MSSETLATTDLMGHELTTDYVRSIVKRQTSRIDANVEVKTKDGYVIRVKPTCFTIKRARSSQIKAIREMMVEIVKRRASRIRFRELYAGSNPWQAIGSHLQAGQVHLPAPQSRNQEDSGRSHASSCTRTCSSITSFLVIEAGENPFGFSYLSFPISLSFRIL